MEKHSRIFVTGHRGLVGSAICRRLGEQGFSNVLTATRQQLDLTDQWAVDQWFKENEPEYVFHVAGKVGGILANSRQQADFLYENLLIHATVLRAAQVCEVKKLLYLGSSCIYPRQAAQPIHESELLAGPLEQTNFGYAIAKISGLLSCQAYRDQYGCNFISAMPTNLYGPNDNFHPENSHVLPALMRRFHEAKLDKLESVTIWGTGTPQREFLHVDDLASACLFLMDHYSERDTINIGTGIDLSIRELAESIRDLIYPDCQIAFDVSKPDGTPRKLLDVTRLQQLGWSSQIPLAAGIQQTYQWYRQNHQSSTEPSAV